MEWSLKGAVSAGSLVWMLLGCSGASWQEVEIESGYQPSPQLKVAIVGARRWPEAARAFEAELLDELDSDGVHATVVSGSSGKADVDITIVKYDPGSRGLRYLVSFGAGAGEIVVEVRSLGIDGTARGWVGAGFIGGSGESAAEAAAELIAETIATGKVRGQPVKSADATY